jgi:hypothetical protein
MSLAVIFGRRRRRRRNIKDIKDIYNVYRDFSALTPSIWGRRHQPISLPLLGFDRLTVPNATSCGKHS